MFCVNTRKCKHYYLLLISRKAKFPNITSKLKINFNLSDEQLLQTFSLPHDVALEPYVKAFQYKVLNNILYTNDKLFKIGFISYKGCTFCKIDSETLTHLLYSCPHSRVFWHDFQEYWFFVRQERIHLTLKDVIVGILTRQCPLLNYFLMIGKIYLWIIAS